MLWKILLPLFVTTLLLFGCSNKSVDLSYADDYTENPQMTSDVDLVKKEETQVSAKGNIQLLEASFEQQKTTVEPMKITISDTKILQVEPDVSMLDYFHVLTTNEEFNIIKAFISIENTSDQVVYFNPSAQAKTDTGEHWTWQEDVYLDGLEGAYEPGQKKQGNIGFILTKKKTPSRLILQPTDVFNTEKEKITTGKEITLPLNEQK